MITLTARRCSPERTASTAIARHGSAAALAVAVAVVAAATAARVGPIVATTVVLGAGAAAAWVDARTGRIPNRLVALAALGVVAIAGVGGAPALVASLAGASVCAAPLLAVHIASPVAIGFGDVKLAAALGGAVGLVDPWLGLVALCVASGGAAAHGLVVRRPAVAFGPWLVLGATVAASAGRVWE